MIDMIFGFILAICFDPTIWQGASQPRWALLAVALPLLVSTKLPHNLTIAHLFGGLFILWSMITMIWAPNKWDGAGELIVLAIIAMSFLLGNRTQDLSRLFCGLAIGISVSALIILIPALRFNSIVSVYPHGLLGNRNMLSEFGALIALGLITHGKWWYLPGPLLAVFYYVPNVIGGQPARSAVGAFSVGIIAYIWNKSKLSAIVLSFAAFALLEAIFFSYHTSSIGERIEVWSMVWRSHTVLGHGIGSLYTVAPYLTDLWDTLVNRIDHAHNDALEILFELGWPGLTLYAGVIGAALIYGDQKTIPILLGFLFISVVAFPWHLPTNAFIGAVLLGHGVRRGPELRSIYALGRETLRHWYEPKWKIAARREYGLGVSGAAEPVRSAVAGGSFTTCYSGGAGNRLTGANPVGA